MMERIQKALGWAILASETSHVFCCVLPTLISISSFMTSLGVIGIMPAGILAFHDVMHRWEVPMVILSGLILALGWLAYGISKRMDCHDTGCAHGPCAPKKDKTSWLLRGATVLFLVNTTIWWTFHAGH